MSNRNTTRLALGLVSCGCVAMMAMTPASAATVRVHPGDTLWKLSKRYHVSLAAVLAANPQVEPLNLRIGSRVNIPTTKAAKPISPQQSSLHRHANPVTKPSSVASQNLYWLSHLIHAEADGEPLKAQIAVGDVVWHRMHAGGYGSTVKQVIFQTIAGHPQFTSVANGWIYTAPTAVNVRAAKAVLQHHTDVVPGALVFYTPSKTPAGSWVWSQPKIANIGDFVFAR
ncbi:MAG: cell wall hydrolase [Alicyclobacillus sp.]|nr:cell wall hydrolase [Alicyclobacillus sp.]